VAGAAERSPDAVESSVVVTMPNGRQQHFRMFDVAELEADAALLSGPLLLEVGESVDIELAFADGSKLSVPATVASAVLAPTPGIRVVFRSGKLKKALGRKLASLRR